MLAAYPLHELHSKASKSVFVGNDKFADSACADAFQNGRKTFAVEVEATGGVADELSAGVAFTKVGTLRSRSPDCLAEETRAKRRTTRADVAVGRRGAWQCRPSGRAAVRRLLRHGGRGSFSRRPPTVAALWWRCHSGPSRVWR